MLRGESPTAGEDIWDDGDEFSSKSRGKSNALGAEMALTTLGSLPISTISSALPLLYHSNMLASLPSLSHHRYRSCCISPPNSFFNSTSQKISSTFPILYGYYLGEDGDDEHQEEEDFRFGKAVALFNKREYYKCHDALEALWMRAEEPKRTLVHGILQCAVGFHHLFNQNHKGAMMELGEGVCKLKRLKLESGPFHEFEREISAVLDFIYRTQIELAACTDDMCLAMDQSERSYQLLGGYAAGQQLYCLRRDPEGITYIVFCPQRYHLSGDPPRVKLPVLNAAEESLVAYELK